MPTPSAATTPSVSPRPGASAHGGAPVRMTKMTSVWVASDSTNQPVRNSAPPAWNTPSMRANVTSRRPMRLARWSACTRQPDDRLVFLATNVDVSIHGDLADGEGAGLVAAQHVEAA